MQFPLVAARYAPWTTFKLWMLLWCLLLNAIQQPYSVEATDDVANVSPCELESIINQLVYPSPEYQLHASALRSQLNSLLRERQLAAGDDQSLNNDYDYPEEDKRSVAALAAQGLLRPGAKRSLATLAKNGQLPTPEPEDNETAARNEEKRYVGALARSGGLGSYGKRNIGTLARDFQLPQNGKRNLATLARLGLLNGDGSQRSPKRNVAAVARYNSNRMTAGAQAEKRNLGALKGSPVHGGTTVHQKRDDEDVQAPYGVGATGSEMDYADMGPSYWWYPSYADLDWGDFGRAQKRFLDTSKDPELFGIENATPPQDVPVHDEDSENADSNENENHDNDDETFVEQKRHIGAVLRSGFLPSYRALRSNIGGYDGFGGGGSNGRFSRSGRARQFVEYFPQRERLRQPIAAVCKRCFLPYYRPVVNWGATGIRGRLPKYIAQEEASIRTNALPGSYDRHPLAYASTQRGNVHSWGTPPRITALHRRSFRRNDPMENYNY